MSLPDGPALPAAAQLLAYWLRPLPLLERCQRRYGDAFTLRLGGETHVVLAAPADARTVFTAPPGELLGGAANELLEPVMGRASLIMLDGAEYNRHRKLLSPPLSGERMGHHTAAVRDATDDVVDDWRPGASFSLLEAAERVTMQVILRAVFGVDRHAALERALRHLLAVASSLPVLLFPRPRGPLSPGARLTRAARAADRLLFAEIAHRRAGPRGPDVLSLLLDDLSDRELRDELVTMLTAGLETTAATIAWAWSLLLEHPAAEERLRAELAAVAGDAPVEAAHLERLPFLDAVVRETLRLRPIFNLSIRKTAVPFRVAGHQLPPGTIVAPCIYLVQRREELWPNAGRFLPERWLDGPPRDAQAWFPFGGGHRRCIGMALAMHEVKVFLATALRRARLARAGGPVRPVRRNIILAPSGGARVRLASAPRSRLARRPLRSPPPSPATFRPTPPSQGAGCRGGARRRAGASRGGARW